MQMAVELPIAPMDVVTLLWAAFSVVAAGVLGLARFTIYGAYDQSLPGRAAAVLCLGLFALLQCLHLSYLLGGPSLMASPWYVVCLCASAAAFHGFFSASLQPPGALTARYGAHIVPVLLLPWLPGHWAVPASFLVGLACSLHLLTLLHRLRTQRRHFAMERGVFILFAGLALVIFVLGLLMVWWGERLYVRGYATAVGISLALVVYALLRFPDLAQRVQESVVSAYAVSTLGRVDRERALEQLRRLMEVERIYTDDKLNMARVAEEVGLAPHQLSELINITFEKSFPRYIRGYRVEAAKTMLLAEPQASVLSVGMAVGFTSQSNFYAAFRELTGQVPGEFRRLNSLPA
jgi:AraC-like DNA-binding protein